MTTSDSNTVTDSGNRWVILGVIYLCMLAFALVLQSLPPILTLVMTELELSHAQGGLLMSWFALPGIIVSIPAGMLVDRYSQKAIGSIALLLMIVGSAIFASAHSMFVLSLGRLVAGAGAMTLLVVAPQLLAQWFAGRELGISMGVFSTAMPLGTVLSLGLLSRVGESLGWRVSVWVSAGLALLALVVFALLFSPAQRSGERISAPSEPLYQNIRSAGTPIWIVGAAWLLFNAAVISLFTFTPDMLKTAGFSIGSAGLITSAVMWPALVLSPIIGYIIDRIGRKRTSIALGGAMMAILLLWVPSATHWVLLLLLIMGIAQAMVPAPIFALTPDITKPETLGLAFGIVSTCLNLGIVVGPFAVGLAKDLTGSYHASYILMSGFALMITVSMIILGLRERQLSTTS
jgi:predicted MFS family arabinose efflux permease